MPLMNSSNLSERNSAPGLPACRPCEWDLANGDMSRGWFIMKHGLVVWADFVSIRVSINLSNSYLSFKSWMSLGSSLSSLSICCSLGRSKFRLSRSTGSSPSSSMTSYFRKLPSKSISMNSYSVSGWLGPLVIALASISKTGTLIFSVLWTFNASFLSMSSVSSIKSR